MLNTASLNMGMSVAMWTCGRSFYPKTNVEGLVADVEFQVCLTGEDDGKKKLKSGKQRNGSQK